MIDFYEYEFIEISVVIRRIDGVSEFIIDTSVHNDTEMIFFSFD
jgi:hypothetical protein